MPMRGRVYVKKIHHHLAKVMKNFYFIFLKSLATVKTLPLWVFDWWEHAGER